MSKILALNSDYLTNNLYYSPKKTPKKLNLSPSFSAATPFSKWPKEAQKLVSTDVEASIDKQLGWIRKPFKYLADTKGEPQTQMITAVFTCTLAPYVISHNPMSKQDQKTKDYAAWRQPISAIIALGGTLPLTMLLNGYQNKMYNDGYNETIDLRPNPTNKEYLKLLFKREYNMAKAENRLQEFLSKYEPKTAANSSKFNGQTPTAEYLKECKKEFMKKLPEQRLNTFTTLLYEDPENIKIENGVIFVPDPKTGKTQELDRNIPNISTKTELDAYLQKNNINRRTMGDFFKETFHFEFYKNGKPKMEMAKRKTSEVLAMDFLRTIGLIDDNVSESDLLRAIMEDRQIKDAKEYAAQHPGVTEDQAIRALAIIGKEEARSNQMALGEVLGKSETLSLGQFLHQVGIKIEPTKNGDEKLEDLMSMKMAEGLKKFRAILSGRKGINGEIKGGKLFEGFSNETPIDTFVKRMLERKTKKLNSYAGNDKYFVGIIVAAAITACTCSILNWVYPRFMERFKPELCSNNPEPPKLPEEKKGGLK